MAPSHFEYCFFEEAYKTIKYIVTMEPDQRVFDEYSFVARIKRIMEFSAHKENLPYLYKLFNKYYLDEVLIEMDNEIVAKFKDVFEIIYRCGYSCVNELLERFDFRSYSAEELLIRLGTF